MNSGIIMKMWGMCAFLSTFQAIELGCLAFGDYQKLLEEEGRTDV